MAVAVALEQDLQTSPYTENSGSGEYFVEEFNSDVNDIIKEKYKLLDNNCESFSLCRININEMGYLPNGWNVYQSHCLPFGSSYMRIIYSNLSSRNVFFIKPEIDKNYHAMYSKYQSALSVEPFTPSSKQEKDFLDLLRIISTSVLCDVDLFEIKVSGDEELLIIKQNEKGVHYLIVGKNPTEIFYGFSGKEPGNFYSVKYDIKNNFNYLVSLFLYK